MAYLCELQQIRYLNFYYFSVSCYNLKYEFNVV